jgi:hypothetical protein
MAVNSTDKVFVVNENINTQYGGVDPTGSFQTIGDLKGYKSLVLNNLSYNSDGIGWQAQTIDVEGFSFIFSQSSPEAGFDLVITEPTWVQKLGQLFILANYTWNNSCIFSAVIEESDLENNAIKFKTYDPVAESFTGCDGANLEIRIYPSVPK